MARLVLAIALAAAFALFPRLSWAQDQSRVFYQDLRMPVAIWADRVSVSHRDKTATFSGNVVVTQGADRIRCARALLHYRSAGSGRHDVAGRLECKQDYLHPVD